MELKYSIRSILINLPCVRKIYILMSNKKVEFLKEYISINDKIVYVNDKEFLGYDNSNSHAFQFRYWKMIYFNISENFIIMDDDYFIGKPLKKSDFFYIENGRAIPSIIAKKFKEETLLSSNEKYNFYRLKAQKKRKNKHHLFLIFLIKLLKKI